MNLLYRIIRGMWKAFLKTFYRVKVVNSKNIPEGKALLVGNHTNLLDGPLVMMSTKRELYFLVKKELHEGKLGFIYKRINTIPVNRGGDTTGAKRITNQKLKEGNKVVIFPEGTINKTEDVIMKFKKGAVHFALDNNCPIVPPLFKTFNALSVAFSSFILLLTGIHSVALKNHLVLAESKYSFLAI